MTEACQRLLFHKQSNDRTNVALHDAQWYIMIPVVMVQLYRQTDTHTDRQKHLFDITIQDDIHNRHTKKKQISQIIVNKK